MRDLAKRNAILQRRYEINYFPKVKRVIQDRISSLISVVERDGVQAGYNHLSKQVDSGGLGKVIEGMYLAVGMRFARIQWQELQKQKRAKSLQTKGFGFNLEWVNFIKDYLFRFLLEKIVYKVSEYTRQVLLNTLSKAIENGWGIAETVRALDGLPLSASQAARIVRTEITRAANTGAMAAGSTFEFEQQKEWISAHDLRTRGTDPADHASHIGMDGQIVDYDEPFTDPRNHDKLMFPGDPEGRAESTINCRCSVAVFAKRDLNGRLIPKRKSIEEVIKIKETKEIEVKEIKEEVEDMSKEVLQAVVDIKDSLDSVLSVVNKPVDTSFVDKIIGTVERRMDDTLKRVQKSNVAVLDSVVSITADNEDNRTKTINEITNGFSKAIKSIPQVKVDQESVIGAIRTMRDDIVSGLDGLKETIKNKPKNYEFVFTRDKSGFLESPIKVISVG